MQLATCALTGRHIPKCRKPSGSAFQNEAREVKCEFVYAQLCGTALRWLVAVPLLALFLAQVADTRRSFKSADAASTGSAGELHSEPQIIFLPNIGRTFSADKWNHIITKILIGFSRDADCVRAFNQAGANLDELFSRGIVIGPTDVLLSAYSDEELTLTDLARKEALRFIDDYDVPAVTTTNFPGMPPSVTDERPHIFLNASAFSGGSAYLREVFAHELLHAGGIPAKRLTWLDRLMGRQDLYHIGERFYRTMRECGETPGE